MWNDVTETQEDLNTWKQKPYIWKVPKPFTRKSCGQRILPVVAFHRLCLSWDGRFCSRHPWQGYQKQKLSDTLHRSGSDWQIQKYGTVGETIEHIIAGCSYLSQSSYLRRHSQLEKIIHYDINYKLLDRNILPYYRFQAERVLEPAKLISYWHRSMITDKMVDLNRPHIVLSERENKKSTCNRYSFSLES